MFLVVFMYTGLFLILILLNVLSNVSFKESEKTKQKKASLLLLLPYIACSS